MDVALFEMDDNKVEKNLGSTCISALTRARQWWGQIALTLHTPKARDVTNLAVLATNDCKCLVDTLSYAFAETKENEIE